MQWLQGDAYVEAMGYIDRAGEVARGALCLRARCGTIIVAKGEIIGEGYNAPPCDRPIALCRKDWLAPTFKSDRTCCIHAEANAVYDALRRNPDLLAGASLYFARLDPDGQAQPSGAPYCSQCSKLALHMGLASFVLYHGDGIRVYGADEYNEITFSSD